MSQKQILIDLDLTGNKINNSLVGANTFLYTSPGAMAYGTNGLQLNESGIVESIIHSGNIANYATTATASNGLTKSSGDIKIGGTLTANTTIDMQGNRFWVTDNSNTSGLLMWESGVTNIFYDNLGNVTQLDVRIDNISLTAVNLSIILDASMNTATVTTPGASLEYFADYSSNYTNRSLVDKEYVDNNSGWKLSGTTTLETGSVIIEGGSSPAYLELGTPSSRLDGLSIETDQNGIYITDQNSGIVFTEAGIGGIQFFDAGGGVGIVIEEQGTGGITLDDQGGSGITLSSSNGDILLTNQEQQVHINTASQYVRILGDSGPNQYIQVHATQGIDLITNSSGANIDISAVNGIITVGDGAGDNIQVIQDGVSDGIVVTLSGSHAFEYASDYSSNYTDRSLVDKEYVDTLVSGGSFTLTDGSGTTANSTSVDLGGTLTGDANITGSAYAVNYTVKSISLQSNGSNGNSNINLNGANLVISGTAGLGFKGAVYGDDYSNYFTNRSLVDKEYVDSEINNISLNNGSGTTASGKTVNLGGNLSQNVEINGVTLYDYTIYDVENILQHSTNDIIFRSGTLTGPGANSISINGATDDIVIALKDADKFRYAADYSANFVDRSFVDKAYVDAQIGQSGTAGIATASNGLTKVGQDVRLGGNLTAVTTINTSGFDYTINGSGSIMLDTDSGVYFNDTNGGGVYFQGDGGGGVYFNDNDGGGTYFNDNGGGGIYLGSAGHNNGDGVYITGRNSAIGLTTLDTSGNLIISLDITQTNAVFTDNRLTKTGIEYSGDYSADYTNRSLVDKAYVDNSITSSTLLIESGNGVDVLFSGNNGTNGTGGSGSPTYQIKLGDLSENTTINASGYNYAFTNVPSYIVSSTGAAIMGVSAGANFSQVNLNNGNLTLISGNSNLTYLDMFNNGGMEISSEFSNFAGLKYDTDYSANYTNRSLVDKEYVDNAISTGDSATKYKTIITGDDVETDFTITHNLATRDVIVQVYTNASPYDTVETAVERTDTNNLLVSFNVAPANGLEYKILITAI